jgi:imidazolonepropionase
VVDLMITNGSVLVDPASDTLPASVGITDGQIVYIGDERDAPAADHRWDVEGRIITAGLVEPHTHLVFGGNRLVDFNRRLGGSTYEEIAASGGGIRSTIAATRAASSEDLIRSAVSRMRWLASTGVTTVEVKSGYGLDVEHELRMLRVAREAAAETGVRIFTTLLPLHVAPDDLARSDYLDLVCDKMIPAAVGVADAVDVFVEGIAFTTAEARRCLEVARSHALALKAHVGQFSDLGGSQLAAEMGALSVDHCEHIPAADAPLLADAGTVAVLVPGASLFLGEEKLPPIDAFRRCSVPMAISTDINPGSSPMASLPLAAALAVHRFGLTPVEALTGVTEAGAAALGVADRRGRIALGFDADLAVWDIEDPTELVYWLGAPLCHTTVVGGVVSTWSRT